MHHDAKVGLGLGILLIGIVSAFFFRNEPSPVLDDFPPLLTADELDREIIDSRTASPKPYTDLDRFEEKYNSGVKLEGIEPRDSTASTIPPSARGLFDQEFDFLNEAPSTPPNPIRTTPVDTLVPPPRDVPVSERLERTPPADLPGDKGMFTDAAAPPNSVQAAPKPVTYRVQPGDTLSGIAEKFLGSPSRFGVIFEANRDRLRSPNDLKPGMELVIPSSSSTATELGDAASSRIPRRVPLQTENEPKSPTPFPADSAATNGPVRLETPITDAPANPSGTPLFQRVPRNPLIPRRTQLKEESPPPSGKTPAAAKPIELPISSPSTSTAKPAQDAPSPDDAKKPSQERKLPSLDGLEPLQIPK